MLLLETAALESFQAHIATLKAEVDKMAQELDQNKQDMRELKAESLARESRLMALLEHTGSGSIFGKLFK